MLTMEELLESLIKKTRYECEEAHRGKVAAMNGLAALQIIQKQVSTSAMHNLPKVPGL